MTKKKETDIADSALIIPCETHTLPAVTPMHLLEKALSTDADIDKLAKLYDLQVRWEEDQARKSFNAAMSGFRSECPAIDKTREGHNSKYAGLAESIEQIKPFMSKYGLSHFWRTNQTDKQIEVTCVVSHKDGHKQETMLFAGADTSGNKNAIQGLGSTVEYLKRYTFFAGFGLASKEQDDDGAGSGKPDVETITADQIYDLQCKLKDVKRNEKGFCTHYKIKSLELLPAAKYADAVKLLTGSLPK